MTHAATNGFPCPVCGAAVTKVTDTRALDATKRRTRRCTACAHRFATYELTVDHLDSGRPTFLIKTAQRLAALPEADRVALLRILDAFEVKAVASVDKIDLKTMTDRVREDTVRFIDDMRKRGGPLHRAMLRS